MKETKHVSIRMNKDIMRKIQYIAQSDNRSPGGLIKHLTANCIRDYEKTHGKIDLPDEPKRG